MQGLTPVEGLQDRDCSDLRDSLHFYQDRDRKVKETLKQNEEVIRRLKNDVYYHEREERRRINEEKEKEKAEMRKKKWRWISNTGSE